MVSTRVYAEDIENGSNETKLVAGQAVISGRGDDNVSQSSFRQAGNLGIYRNFEVSVEVDHVKHGEE
jgi:hypothetical protein